MLHTLYGQSLRNNANFFIEYFALDLLMVDDLYRSSCPLLHAEAFLPTTRNVVLLNTSAHGLLTSFKGQVLPIAEDSTEKAVPGLYAASEAACVSVHGLIDLGPIPY